MTLETQVEYMNQAKGNLKYYVCNVCANKGFLYVVVDDEIKTKTCECMTIRKINSTILKSGLDHDFKNYRFDNFITKHPYQKKMKDIAIDFLKNETRAIIYSGMTGSGKSHICTAIVHELALKYKGDFKYVRFAQDFVSIQKGIKNYQVDVKQKAEDELQEMKTVKVLYIDDFMKVGSLDNVFDLIDARYKNHHLITVISTELTSDNIKSLDMAIHGRLREMCGVNNWVNIHYDESKNYRLNTMEV